DHVPTFPQQTPERLRRIRAARETAAHPDDRDGLPPRALDRVQARLELLDRAERPLQRRRLCLTIRPAHGSSFSSASNRASNRASASSSDSASIEPSAPASVVAAAPCSLPGPAA